MNFPKICPFCNKKCNIYEKNKLIIHIECQNQECFLSNLTRYSIFEHTKYLAYNIGVSIYNTNYMLFSKNKIGETTTKIYKNGNCIYDTNAFVDPDINNINEFASKYILKILKLMIFK